MLRHARMRYGTWLTIGLLIVGGTVAARLAIARTSNGATTGLNYVTPKQFPVMSTWATATIPKTADNGRVKVWVYFTDKGFADQSGLTATAARKHVTLTERARLRRAKVGKAAIAFEDIPVRDDYVQRVLQTGATYRRVSRWLNAVSIEIEPSRLNDLAALPFVRKIDPVIAFAKREPVTIDAKEQAKTPTAASAENPNLSYGASFTQLQQINVPAVHNLGYSGAGVLVSMFDTGYRKDHVAFAQAYTEGRVLAEWDFVFDDGNTQDEAADQPGQHNHGTYTWSALGGEADGSLYGPAYGAQFLLAKTEDIRSETPVEEDNWMAAMEWADSIGTDVISSSLTYSDWYTVSDFNGDNAVVTQAADLAASYGIVCCISAANSGPSSMTVYPAADGDSVIAVGAVYSTGTIASFSSRGPTFDGRIKPEVCAMGVSTACASPSSTTGFTTASGTSLSCPLVGGSAALLLEAHPDWTPMQVREALMMTASQSATPDNTYGWGIIDVLAALNYTFGPSYLAGDLNYDESVDVLDINILIDVVFYGSSLPAPPVTADINLDTQINTLDIVYMIDYIFRGGDAPPYP